MTTRTHSRHAAAILPSCLPGTAVLVSFLDFAPSLKAADLYVAYGSTNVIEKFAPSGTDLGTFASTDLNRPVGLAFDKNGNLYAADYNTNTIEKFGPTGTDLGAFATTGLDQPVGLAFDSNGNLYAANDKNSTVEKFSSTGTTLACLQAQIFLVPGIGFRWQWQPLCGQP